MASSEDRDPKSKNRTWIDDVHINIGPFEIDIDWGQVFSDLSQIENGIQDWFEESHWESEQFWQDFLGDWHYPYPPIPEPPPRPLPFDEPPPP